MAETIEGWPNSDRQVEKHVDNKPAYHDPKRPSPAFADFLLTTLKDGDDVKLLLTREPTREKVEGYLSAINPLVGSRANVGDVSITFDGGAWNVNRHAIAV